MGREVALRDAVDLHFLIMNLSLRPTPTALLAGRNTNNFGGGEGVGGHLFDDLEVLYPLRRNAVSLL